MTPTRCRARHKLRIRAKKVRYGLEFFESLFSGKGERKQLLQLSKRLKELQDALGSLNDFTAHREMTEQAALHAPRSHRRSRSGPARPVAAERSTPWSRSRPVSR